MSFPSIELHIVPLQSPKLPFVLSNFLEYSFDNSLLVPVDSFSFSFVAPNDFSGYQAHFDEGDVAILYAAGVQLATGVITGIDDTVESDYGERVDVNGMDLMCQFEMQDAISIDSTPIFGQNITVSEVFNKLHIDTRINTLRLQNAPSLPYLFATEPGESKLAALSRYLEPLNCLAWMDPDGAMRIGRPNMAQDPMGDLVLDKKYRRCNVINMKSSSSASTIPNIIVPLWLGQENVVARVGRTQGLVNAAKGPRSLLAHGWRIPKCVTVSNPQGGSPQDLSVVNDIRAGGGNLLNAYAKREMARQNTREKIVQVTMPGHFDAKGNPFRVDTVFNVYFDRAQIQEKMYVFHANYTMKEAVGPRTNLFLTRLGTIVSDIIAP